MASKTKAECLLNTTECVLETIASILSEIQEQNNEYDWDPLTFIFTAIIGVVAIAFAALTAFQAFLAAGPGRIKSGAYVIGPWSRRNYRKFDWAEMRFRTTSSTPILKAESLNLGLLEEFREGSNCSDQDPGGLRKSPEDYFPATWLALLTHLSLDCTNLWEEVKLTGADFFPSEFSAVPAYGSIRFVAILAMILSRGRGRLTIDRESGLPRVRDTHFNLIFRQHPLLGAIGVFEIYGNMYSRYSFWHHEIHRRLLQAHGHMSIHGLGRYDSLDKILMDMGQLLTFNRFEGKGIDVFTNCVRQECSHHNEEPKPACINLLDHVKDFDPEFFMGGPLYLFMAHIPDLLPSVFPHKKVKLRERLDTLLLQSRFWGCRSMAYCDIIPNPLMNSANYELDLTSTGTSWAKSIDPDIHELELGKETFELSLKYLKESPTQDREHNDKFKDDQNALQHELRTIDSWLGQIKSHALCRQLTLSVVGDGVRQIVNVVQQEPIPEAPFHAKNATVPSSRRGLEGSINYFLDAIERPGSFNSLYASVQSPMEIRRDTSELLIKILDLWKIEEQSLEDKVSGREDGAERAQEYKSRTWKLPNATHHPLDDIIIYRAVLMTLLYCLSSDSSALMDESYGLIVPIM
ncbi:Ff.00g075180.m01.CDS01 [Fusarium sp. VM40]|nr:Ff.00g075180.m01.CDS01 [Fusarium sp. VM40]